MLRLSTHEVSKYFANMGQIHIFNHLTNQPINDIWNCLKYLKWMYPVYLKSVHTDVSVPLCPLLSAFPLPFSPSQPPTFSSFRIPHSHFRILSNLLIFPPSLFSAFRIPTSDFKIPTSEFCLTFPPSHLLALNLPHSAFPLPKFCLTFPPSHLLSFPHSDFPNPKSQIWNQNPLASKASILQIICSSS